MDRHDGDREDDDHGDWDEDEETGMDVGCLDADTSGDECERMSLSGDHTTTAPGNVMEDASTTVGNPQDGSMGANNIFRTENINQIKPGNKAKPNSIFDLERPPPIPAEKNSCKVPTATKTPPRDESGGRIIVIGASHLYRTVEYLPANTVSLATPGFKPTKEKITELERRIDALELSSTDTVVLDLLSNTAYMGTDDEGLPLPAFRSGDGSYHVAGTLTTAPPTTLKKTLDLCTQIGKKLASTKVILVCTTPRYVLEKCRNDPNHIDNFNNDDYGDDLTDFQDQHRRLLGGWGVSLGLNFDILDLTAVAGPVEPTLGKRTTNTGASIWSEGDSVILSREA
jgi:hypothetical protein